MTNSIIRPWRASAAALVVLVVTALAACGDDGASSADRRHDHDHHDSGRRPGDRDPRHARSASSCAGPSTTSPPTPSR